MEYITFIERNHKEGEVFLSYLQYTGNEDELQKLEKFMSGSKTDLRGGHCSEFQINLDVRFSVDVVDQMCKLPYGEYARMFEKVSGKFKFPLEDTEGDTALRMDEMFGCNNISRYIERCIDCNGELGQNGGLYCSYACKVRDCGCKASPECCG
jgi:hypothetical protein